MINLSDLGLEDNSQLTCEARNGAQDGEGNELYDSASITLIVKGEETIFLPHLVVKGIRNIYKKDFIGVKQRLTLSLLTAQNPKLHSNVQSKITKWGK